MEKKKPKKVYITPHCLDKPQQPIVTKFSKVGGIDEVIKRTNFGVDRLIGVGSAGSWKLAFPIETRHDL